MPFLGRSDSRVQKQLYLQNGTGYPHQILNEHGKRVDNAESVEISKEIFAELCLVFACTVTYGRTALVQDDLYILTLILLILVHKFILSHTKYIPTCSDSRLKYPSHLHSSLI